MSGPQDLRGVNRIAVQAAQGSDSTSMHQIAGLLGCAYAPGMMLSLFTPHQDAGTLISTKLAHSGWQDKLKFRNRKVLECRLVFRLLSVAPDGLANKSPPALRSPQTPPRALSRTCSVIMRYMRLNHRTRRPQQSCDRTWACARWLPPPLRDGRRRAAQRRKGLPRNRRLPWWQKDSEWRDA